MKNLFILLLLSLSFFSCEQKKNNAITFAPSAPIVKEEKKQENIQESDTIFMNFKDDENAFTAESRLDSLHSKVYIKFKNDDLGELKAEILPADGKGNIRFNQILFPDKTSDGPFGMDLKMPLKQKGNYILIIGHSLMADNPYYGKFNVKLEIK
ncbi:hypothetical protein RB619_09140 [Flavobacterium sp. LHD-80]|uniref:hypothetical protein n=1 Tax=Flavobacterium sp. LHD-80 TaxID=3071411 RepID=UPI0027DEAC4F|nr:hypothetical protein [Flavobacterium sp. LHD-80]MDQ6470803.1 hypothetical protein [Flavobacterium sp. LHD-80]